MKKRSLIGRGVLAGAVLAATGGALAYLGGPAQSGRDTAPDHDGGVARR